MTIRSAKDLGALVRERRKELGWSQKDLAARADVSALWVSQFERGKSTVHLGLVLRLLKELQLGMRVGQAASASATVTRPGAGPDGVDLDAIIERHTGR